MWTFDGVWLDQFLKSNFVVVVSSEIVMIHWKSPSPALKDLKKKCIRTLMGVGADFRDTQFAY